MSRSSHQCSASKARKRLHVSSANRTYGIGRRIAFAIVVMGTLVIGCGGWAATAQMAGAVVSHGSVVVGRHVKKIQHREGGIIAAIKARNGASVAAGEILINLDDTQTRAELAVVQSQLAEFRARLARLAAERDGARDIEFPIELTSLPAATSIIAGETQLFVESRKARESQKQQLFKKIEQSQEEVQGIAFQREAKQSELDLIRKELNTTRNLQERQLTPQTRVYALEREEARIAGEHGSLVSQGGRVGGQISEIRLQVLNLDQTARAEAQRELRNVEGRIAELIERQVAAQDRLNRMEIKAPQAGIVHQLGVHTIGGIVSPAEPIMLIVPDGEALEIELKIAPADIDQVFLGQPVRLQFTAFNQRTTPQAHGEISYIAPDISQDAKSRQDFFLARVSLTAGTAWKIGEKPILPGMPVEAFLATGSRTALSFLTKPITDHFSRTFRER